MAKFKKLKTNKRIEGKQAKGTRKGEGGKGRLKLTELSLRNSQLWESRLALSESQQKAFRKKNNELAEQIYGLQELVHNSEKDIINVIAYLKDIDETKSVKIVELQAELRTRKNAYEQERDELDSKLRDRVQQLSDELTEKEEIVRSQWQKLESLREFLEKRQQLEAEILKLRLELRTQKLCCEEKIKLLELKFYTDKKKMEASFEKTVEDITRRAHHQATAHLMKAAQTALKQNTELREDLELQNERASVLSIRLEESEDRSKKRQIIIEELEAAASEHQKKLNTLMEENGKLRTETKELRQLVGRLKKQASEQDTRVRIQLEHCNQEAAAHLQQMFEEVRLEKLRAARIKALGEKILQERSVVEVFLLSALREVREEIDKTRKEYAKAAEKAFRHQMVLANRDESNYPRIRTFQPGLPYSTNSVFKDFDAAETPTLTSDSQLSLSDLTLEQKERVLRRLFEKINATRNKPLQPFPREDKPGNRTPSVQSILPALASGSPNERCADDDGDSTTMTTKLSPISLSPAEVTVQSSAVHANAGRPDETPHTSDDTRGEEKQKGIENSSRTSDDCPASEEMQIGLKLETKPNGPQVTDDGLIAFEAENDRMVGPSGFQSQLPETVTGRPLVVEGSKIDRSSVSTADLHDASVGISIVGPLSTVVTEGSPPEGETTAAKREGVSHEEKDITPDLPKETESVEAHKDVCKDPNGSHESTLDENSKKIYQHELGTSKHINIPADSKEGGNQVKKPSIETEEDKVGTSDEKITTVILMKEDDKAKRLEYKAEIHEFSDVGKVQELEPERGTETVVVKRRKKVEEKRSEESPDSERQTDADNGKDTE
ncbi:hypothetical protein AAHC03_0849 [Spirometra sp. Aus1]